MSHVFQSFLQQKSILSQRLYPYIPQYDGVAKCKNHNLLDVHTLILESLVPSRFQVEGLFVVVDLINHSPFSILHFNSLYSFLCSVSPYYNSLHVFGCVCFVHLPLIKHHKLVAQSIQFAFLGCSDSHKRFMCYDANAKLCISQNVIFLK